MNESGASVCGVVAADARRAFSLASVGARIPDPLIFAPPPFLSAPIDIILAGPYNLGFALAVLVALHLARRARPASAAPLAWSVLLALTVAGAIVGSKLIFFDFQPIAPGEKTNLGGIVGGVVLLTLVARVLGLGAWRSLDAVTVPTLVGLAIGRVGCFLAGCCAGTETTLPWAVHDRDGHAVHPVQLYEAAGDLLIAGLLHRFAGRTEGARILPAVLGYAALRFSVEFVRDGRSIHYGLNLVQWSLIGIAIALVIAAHARSKAQPTAAPAAASTATRVVPLALAAIVLLVSAAFALSDWFVPLEQLALLLLAGGLVAAGLATTSARHLTVHVAPRLGAILILQEPTPEATPRRELLIGGRGFTHAWEQAVGQEYGTNCEGEPTSTPTIAKRTMRGGEVSLGLRLTGDSTRRTLEARFISGRDRLGFINSGPIAYEAETNQPWAIGAAMEGESPNASTRIELLGGTMNRPDAPPITTATLSAQVRFGDAKGFFTEWSFAEARYSTIHREFPRAGIGYTLGRDRARGAVTFGNGVHFGLFVPVRSFDLELVYRQLHEGVQDAGGGSSTTIGLRRRVGLRK